MAQHRGCVARVEAVVRLLLQELPADDHHTEELRLRCWAAVDEFLVGSNGGPLVGDSRHLRTMNFSSDLYEDYLQGAVPLEEYVTCFACVVGVV